MDERRVALTRGDNIVRLTTAGEVRKTQREIEQKNYDARTEYESAKTNRWLFSFYCIMWVGLWRLNLDNREYPWLVYIYPTILPVYTAYAVKLWHTSLTYKGDEDPNKALEKKFFDTPLQ